MLRLGYSLCWLALIPALVLRLLWRARRQPEYLQHISERWGAHSESREPTLWIHAVSVGETRAAAPLVRALLARHPDHHILLTHMTPTGRATAGELFGDDPRVSSAYLPYDLPWAVAAFLERARPRLGVIMETEIWPNLFTACKRRGVPLVLANARLSERSARGYRKIGALAREALEALSVVGAQTPQDGARLTALGAGSVQVTGNIKFDAAPPPAQQALGKAFRAQVGGRPVLLAASTREGEEALILDAFARLGDEDVLLLLVPRHPQRFDEVARLASDRGLKLQRRSDNQRIAPETRVWLGDSMGEMFAYYQMAEVALIGGSWLPFGGQNLIEACAVGCPVVVGPHTFNFAAVAEEAEARGAALGCANAEAGMTTALALLKEPARRRAMGQAGIAFVTAHQGATQRTLDILEGLLAPDQGHAPRPGRPIDG
ncbi:MAG: lipid IV(A) 3-deoxy-D-manno-octulosonic acid transferase [Rhodocyclaceae bacterium]|nr:lipid IV(A) 3-deoxy-D-manno-octulosonic acid transferase [Rhodocyclaceae bacterium]